MKNYFYKLLHKYLSLYVSSQDKLIEIDPNTSKLFDLFSNPDKAIVCIDRDAGEMKAQRLESFGEIVNFEADYLIFNGTLHYIRDIQSYMKTIRGKSNDRLRVIMTYYSSAWKPIMRLGVAIGLRDKTPEENWLSHEDIDNLLYLSGFEVIKRDNRILVPIYIPLISNIINRYLAPLPFFRLFSLLNVVIAKPITTGKEVCRGYSVSVIVPAKNEAGNIESAILRIPKMGTDDEIIFVEGNSTDQTWDRIQEITRHYGNKMNIRSVRQGGRGKGDAVRAGFSLAKNDILMILDADLTVPPEDLPKFYDAIVEGKGEFINGSRLVYPMEKEAMRFFNILGNKFFAVAFSFVLGQRFKDTLCGTKVLMKKDYLKIADHRKFFGDFDPFGDFDLLFGAARLALKIVEIPVAYKERTYGTTNISRWRDGFILLRMLLFGAKRMKFV